MSDRNYDYLPDDADELKAEIARLERKLSDLEDSIGEKVEAAAKAERERIAQRLVNEADKCKPSTAGQISAAMLRLIADEIALNQT